MSVKSLLGLGALSLCAALTGCSSTTADVGVFLSDDIQNTYGFCPSLEVDIVGLTEQEQRRLLAYDVDKYFAPPQQFRKSLGVVTFKFSENDMVAKELPDDALAWEGWESKGADYIALIANLPLIAEGDKDPVNDPRKIIINMHDGRLKDSSAHYFVISGSGVVKVKEAPKTGKVETVEGK